MSLRRNNRSKHGMSSARASEKKRTGHLREQVFSNQFTNATMRDISEDQNYSGPSSDCIINKAEYRTLLYKLGVSSGATSVKGGANYQFHLGQIPELEDKDTLQVWEAPDPKRNNPDKTKTCWKSRVTIEQKKQALISYDFWKKYLGKGDVLAIWPDDDSQVWIFFPMREVLNLMINPNKISWHFLETGRIKGYCKFKDNTTLSTITFEYRKNKGFTLGANSGAGFKKFFPWLLENVKHVNVRRIRL